MQFLSTMSETETTELASGPKTGEKKISDSRKEKASLLLQDFFPLLSPMHPFHLMQPSNHAHEVIYPIEELREVEESTKTKLTPITIIQPTGEQREVEESTKTKLTPIAVIQPTGEQPEVEESKKSKLTPIADLQRTAELREVEESTKTKLTPTGLDFLGKMFDEVYTMLVPSRENYEARQTLIDFVDKFANKNIRGKNFNNYHPSVRAFGSYTMNLFTSESDLDLSVNLGYTGDAHRKYEKYEKIKVLKKLRNALNSAQGKGSIRVVFGAIVPVLKFVDCKTGIECDISIENRDGILKSELLHIFSSIDSRFPQLCYLVKAWAKKHNINSSKDRTLNSLSLILLVALHLQTRSPPILPPFHVFLEGLCFEPDGHGLPEVEKRVLPYKDFGKHNKECVAELFISLLCKLSSVETLWEQGLCASTYEGSWISKMLGKKVGCINVEDFTIRSENAARSVAKEQCKTIYKCIRETVSQLQQPLRSLSEASVLKEYLFGSESRNTSSHSQEEERKFLGKRNIPYGDDRANSKATRISEEERRGKSCAGELPVLHSTVERTNFVPRNGVSVVGNAANSSHSHEEEKKILGMRNMPFGDDWANSKATRISEKERRGKGCAGEFPVLHSTVERTNFVPRNGVIVVGNAANSSYSHEEERKILGMRNIPFGDDWANSKATRISEEERRGMACAGQFPVLHSRVETTNFVPRNGISGVGNAAYPSPRYLFPPTPGYRYPIEQAQGSRYSQRHDSWPGPLLDLQSEVRYNQWQDLGHRSRYGQGHGPAHEVPHWVPYEERFATPYHNASAHEASHIIPFDANFVHQSNWIHNNQMRW